MKSVTRRAALGAGAAGIVATVMAPSMASAETVNGYDLYGGIGAKWRNGGRNVLGNPTSPEMGIPGNGRIQFFERGAIYYRDDIGAIVNFGAIRNRYVQLGSEGSWLGYPIRDEYGVGGGGTVQWYEKGCIYWSPSTGAQALNSRGAIFDRWARGGHENGYGFPLHEESALRDGGTAISYQNNATIYWGPGIGSNVVRAGMRNEYWAQGGDTGILGMPTGEERGVGSNMVAQNFRNGVIYFSDRYGPHAIWGGLFAAYSDRGFENGFLQKPTSSPYRSGNTTRMNFEGGILSVTDGQGNGGTVGWSPSNPWRFGPTMSPPWEGPHDLTPGWNGVKVNLVQKKVGTYGTGRQVTMNAATMNGVRRFQRNNGLSQTGTVDERTWNAMRTGYNWNIDGWTQGPLIGLDGGRDVRINEMINFCRRQVGAPYTWGAAGPYELGYDCSGLALQSMNAAGLYTGLTHVQHAAAGWLSTHYFYNSDKFAKVPVGQARRGDWVFYRDSGRTIRHMALVTDPGRMIHAYNGRTYELNFSTKLGNNFYWIADTAMRPFD